MLMLVGQEQTWKDSSNDTVVKGGGVAKITQVKSNNSSSLIMLSFYVLFASLSFIFLSFIYHFR